MESIEKKRLMHNAEKYGYQMVGPESASASDVLQQMVMSTDGRMLEGVPVVLTNMLMTEKSLPLVDIEAKLPNALQRRFRMLVSATYQLLLLVPNNDKPRKQLHHFLDAREPSIISFVKQKLDSRETLNIGAGLSLDAERLINTYRNYVVHQPSNQQSLAKEIDGERENALQQSLSELFTEKQRELIFKVMRRESLSKTEREYYSRIVKPRMKALHNQDMQTLVSTLLGY